MAPLKSPIMLRLCPRPDDTFIHILPVVSLDSNTKSRIWKSIFHAPQYMLAKIENHFLSKLAMRQSEEAGTKNVTS